MLVLSDLATRPRSVRYARMVTVADEIVRSRYVSLTTYRKDGTPVATPVWHVPHNAELWIVTEAGSGKVKRIRNNPQVRVAPCSIRGTVAPDAPRRDRNGPVAGRRRDGAGPQVAGPPVRHVAGGELVRSPAAFTPPPDGRHHRVLLIGRAIRRSGVVRLNNMPPTTRA